MKIKQVQQNRVIAILSVILLSLACYFMFFAIPTTSDTFIEEVWSRALLSRGISAWYNLLFTFSPAYFPDFLGYFLSKLMFSNIIIKVYSTTIFQISMLLLSIIAVFKSLGRKGLPLYTSILLITCSIVLLSAHYPGMWLWYYSTNDNLGATILAFFALALIVDHISNPRWYKMVLLFMLIAFAVVNGKLIVVTLIAPALFTLFSSTVYSYIFLENRYYFRETAKLFVVVSLAYFFATNLLEPFVNPHSTASVKLASGCGIVPSLNNIVTNVEILYGYHDLLIQIILFGWLLSVVISVYLILKNLRQSIPENNSYFFALFALTAIVLNFIGPIAAGIIGNDPANFRYFFSLAIFPLLVIIAFLTSKQLVKFNYVFLIICLLLTLKISQDQRRTVAQVLQKIPSTREARIADCIDHYVDTYHLTRGVSDYWNSYSVSFLSHKNVEIYPVCNTLEPCVGMDLYPYSEKESTKKYDFILVTDNKQFQFFEKYILLRAPKPDVSLACPDHTQLLIYIAKKNEFNTVLQKQWVSHTNKRIF